MKITQVLAALAISGTLLYACNKESAEEMSSPGVSKAAGTKNGHPVNSTFADPVDTNVLDYTQIHNSLIAAGYGLLTTPPAGFVPPIDISSMSGVVMLIYTNRIDYHIVYKFDERNKLREVARQNDCKYTYTAPQAPKDGDPGHDAGCADPTADQCLVKFEDTEDITTWFITVCV